MAFLFLTLAFPSSAFSDDTQIASIRQSRVETSACQYPGHE